MSKNNSFYLYFNKKKKIKTTLGFTVHNTRKQKPCLLSSHILNFIFLRTISGVKLQLQWPRGTTCARKLRYTEFMIVQLDTYKLQYCSKLKRSLMAEVDRQKLTIHFFLSIFLKFFISFICLCISLYIHLQINILSLPGVYRCSKAMRVGGRHRLFLG